MPPSRTVFPTTSSLALQFLSCRCSYRRHHTRRQRSQRQQQRSHTMTNEETSLAADFQIPEWPSSLAHHGRRTDPARLRRVPCPSACIQQAKARSSRTAFLLGALVLAVFAARGVPLRAQRERPEDRSATDTPAGSSRLASGGLRSVPFRAHSTVEREPVSAEVRRSFALTGGCVHAPGVLRDAPSGTSGVCTDPSPQRARRSPGGPLGFSSAGPQAGSRP